MKGIDGLFLICRFYIGCDLCSNWFHGSCVDISEDMAKRIDSYVCDECKRQRETATEELYCLCKTPYDDTQWVHVNYNIYDVTLTN